MSKLEDLKKKYAVLILTENHGDIAWLLRRVERLEEALEGYCNSEMNCFNPCYIDAQTALAEEDE